MDSETAQVNSDQKRLKDLVGHEGWGVARRIFTEKILELQSVADFANDLDTCDPQKLLHEMKANKRASEILFGFLREIEGTASQADEVPQTTKSYIVDLDKTP